jgi:hypothetical protein
MRRKRGADKSRRPSLQHQRIDDCSSSFSAFAAAALTEATSDASRAQHLQRRGVSSKVLRLPTCS